MIAHVLRLAVGERHKLRRRWIPWILLGIIVFIMQALVWVTYVSHHFGDSASSRDTRSFTLPYSIGDTIEGSSAFFVIPIIILAASVMGVEYGLGTLRTTLTRGVGRWQLLSAKLIMLMAAGIAGIIVLSALIAIASIAAGVIPPAEEGPLIVTEAQAWLDAAITVGKMMYALAPYVALAVFLAVVTQSTAQGISLSLGYYVLELVIAPILGGVVEWLENVLEVALLGPNTIEWMEVAGEQPDTLRAFFVILAYTVVFVAAALWVFQHRDVAGAKGE